MRRVIYKELTQSRRFGVELELSNNKSKSQIGYHLQDFESLQPNKRPIKVTLGSTGWADTHSNNYWHVKYDSTCGPLGKGEDSGWEIASYIGCGNDDINRISRAAWYLKSVGCETNKNCGLHIHVESKDFDAYMMGVLLARWIKVEDALIKICDRSRWKNDYSQPLRARVDYMGIVYSPIMPRSFWSSIQPRNLEKHNNLEKRYVLNTVGFATGLLHGQYEKNTIELRLPECILEEAHVRNWTSLILNFVEAASKKCLIPENLEPCKSIEEVLIYLGLSEEENFCFLDDNLLNLKAWVLRKISDSDISLATQARKHLEFIAKV